MLAKYFIERPVLSNVIAVLVVLIGAISILYLPVSQYPPITPPTVQVTTRYPGRQRADRHRHRGAADRAAGQRRREHALHAVDLRRRRHLRAHRDVRGRHRSRRGAGAGAEPPLGRARVAAPGRPVAGRRHQEEEHRDPADRHPDLARRLARQPVSLELRGDLPAGHPGPSPRGRRRQRVRHRAIQHAGLARSEPDEGALPHAGRCDQRDPAAEPGGGGGPDRLPARAVRAGVPVHPRPARPLHGRGPVRADHRQGRDRHRRRHHADPRRRTRRARRADLQPVHGHGRQARRGHRHLPASRRQRLAGRTSPSRPRWRASPPRSRRGSRRRFRSTRRASCGRPCARSTSPWPRRLSSSWWSSCCSSRTGAPPSCRRPRFP